MVPIPLQEFVGISLQASLLGRAGPHQLHPDELTLLTRAIEKTRREGMMKREIEKSLKISQIKPLSSPRRGSPKIFVDGGSKERQQVSTPLSHDL